MSSRYIRLFLIALFVWVAVLGFRSGSWRLVIVPFLALGALFLVRETLSEKFPGFGRELGAALVTLVFLYNIYFSVPALRSWLASQFPQATVATERLQEDADLRAAETLEPAALASRKALHQYLLRKEDIVGQRIKADLDALNAKREQGTFGPADEKKEQEVLKQFQRLARDRSELQKLIAGTAAEVPTQNPGQPTAAPLPQPLPQTQQHTQPNAEPTGNSGSGANMQSSPLTSQQAMPDGTQPVATRNYRLTPTLPLQPEPTEYDISIQQCTRQSEDIHCWGYVKNVTDGTIDLRMNHTYSTFVDDEGNAGTFLAMVATNHVIPGAPIRYEFNFHDSHRNVKSLSFEIKVVIEGDPSPRIRYDTFTFKDVSLQ